MDTPLPLEARLALYTDTASQATGQYFCNSVPFSIPRTGNKVTVLPTGKDALHQIHDAMLAAKSFVWIADWQMACDVELTSRGMKDNPGRLHNVIAYIISRKKVQIRILLYSSLVDSKPGTYDGLVTERINALNRPEYPGSVHVLCQTPTSSQRDAKDYSHHQKFVVVDGQVAFIGGIDLSYGRWETPLFDVVLDPEKFVINDMYNPCQKKLRQLSSIEKEKIRKYAFVEPYGGNLLDEGCQPRMPWQDVHTKIEGPSVVDIHRNFTRRWNSTIESMLKNRRMMGDLSGAVMTAVSGRVGKYRIHQKWLREIGAWDLLTKSQQQKTGGAQVQIVRSVSADHLHMEGSTPEDLLLYPTDRERELWKTCLDEWQKSHQPNILNSMVNCIRSANNYIYIETQLFISKFGAAGSVDSAQIGNENTGIKNTIVDELAKRIDQHIRAKHAGPFHVYLVVPAHPEGALNLEEVWKQHWLALSTIKHGNNSLVNRIKRSLQSVNRSPKLWSEYLTVLNMRNYGVTVMYARHPSTFDEDFSREIGRYVVTEQIYIHSKLMIVDDAVAIIGSANTNDRSLTGTGDTEIAAVIVDTEGVELRDLGSPQFKVQTRKFARELRESLWKKHFGFFDTNGADSEYFPSISRATRAKAQTYAHPPHPPRDPTTGARIERSTATSWANVLTRPCDRATVKAIQQIARQNAAAYEKVFIHTPRNSIATLEEIGTMAYCDLPYPPAYNSQGSMLYSIEQTNHNRSHIPPELHYSIDKVARDRAIKIDDERIAKGVQVPIGKVDIGTALEFGGVIPPRLHKKYMTGELYPHQQEALREPLYFRRQQLYPSGEIHNVAAAIAALKSEVIGFFVEAPLDWGKSQRVKNDPTKVTVIDVDIA